MHWPGKITPGQVSSEICASMDVFPTILDAAGIDKDVNVDGISLIPHALNNEKNPQRPIFWEMENQKAVRKGKWKLVLDGQLVENESPIAKIHLSDLESDPAEKINLADSEPEIRDELHNLLTDWISGIEDEWKRNFSDLDYEYVAHGMV